MCARARTCVVPVVEHFVQCLSWTLILPHCYGFCLKQFHPIVTDSEAVKNQSISSSFPLSLHNRPRAYDYGPVHDDSMNYEHKLWNTSPWMINLRSISFGITTLWIDSAYGPLACEIGVSGSHQNLVVSERRIELVFVGVLNSPTWPITMNVLRALMRPERRRERR